MSELRDPKAIADLFLKKVLARMAANRKANKIMTKFIYEPEESEWCQDLLTETLRVFVVSEVTQ